jgi:hypothetical protein
VLDLLNPTSTPTKPSPEPARISSDAAYDPAWDVIGRWTGYFAAGALFVNIVLFLADSFGLLGAPPAAQADEADFWSGQFAYAHRILWDIVLRDTLEAAAFVALVVLGLAMLNLVGIHRAVAQVMAALFGIGAIFTSIGDLAYLANAEFWRVGDWSGLSVTSMIAAGRDTYAIFVLSQLFENGGFLTLAVGLFCLGKLSAPRGPFPKYLRYLTYAESGLLLLLVIASEARLTIVFNIIALVSALLVPAILVVIARQFERTRA